MRNQVIEKPKSKDIALNFQKISRIERISSIFKFVSEQTYQQNLNLKQDLISDGNQFAFYNYSQFR